MSRESREGVAVNEVDNLEGTERPVNVATGPTVTRAQEWLVSVCVMHKGGLRITRIYMYMGDLQQTDDHYQLHANVKVPKLCASVVLVTLFQAQFESWLEIVTSICMPQTILPKHNLWSLRQARVYIG